MRMIIPVLILGILSSGGPLNAQAVAPSIGNEAATVGGKGWSAGTGSVAVAANNELDVVLNNPSGNTCKAVITFRRYANPNNSVLQFQTYSNPTTITTNVATVGSRTVGAAAFTGMSLGYAVRAAGSMGGTAGVASPLFASTEEDINVPLVVNPGTSTGVTLTGAAGAVLAATVNLDVTFVGYCL